MGRKSSYLTVLDQFCGAGGSSIGAVAAGVEVRIALNHWKLAIETHSSNFPGVEHDCADISATDPRRYRSTDILITSPECTNHSLAKGAVRRNAEQRGLFGDKIDPAEERSRATMWDVVRFAEVHDYRIVIVENVVDVRFWRTWGAWLHAMDSLGYRHQLVSLNSMFAHPTPQSRDRLYIVFSKKGNRAPDLAQRPQAPCPKCGEVEAAQAWKASSKTGYLNDAGRYKRQYVFICPSCRREVTPYYYAALNAIDWSLPAERIGDRARPLKERTMERIRYGLEKYGRTPLLIHTRRNYDLACRVRSVADPGGTQTGDADFGLAAHLLVGTSHHKGNGAYVRSAGEEMPTQTTAQELALVAPLLVTTNMTTDKGRVRGVHEPGFTHTGSNLTALAMPFLATAGSRETAPSAASDAAPTLTGSERLGLVAPFMITNRRYHRVKSIDEPLDTFVAGGTHHALIQGAPAPFLVTLRGTADDQMPSTPNGLDEPIGTVSAGGRHHALISGAALMTLRDSRGVGYLLREVTEPLATQVSAATQDFLIQRRPYLVSYYGTDQAADVADPVPTIPSLDHHALIEAEQLRVEDCYFRMLQPHEIGAAMAFPGTYKVLGTKREKVKQYGNAVTPPAMAWLIQRCVESLHPEKRR